MEGQNDSSSHQLVYFDQRNAVLFWRVSCSVAVVYNFIFFSLMCVAQVPPYILNLLCVLMVFSF